MTDDSERWRPLPGFEDCYLISDLGRVWSIERTVRNSATGHRQVGGYFLAVSLNSHGYAVVRPVRDNRGPKVAVHILVARAFLGPPPVGMEVCHRNGDRSDPRLSNLRYGTHASNMADVRRHGTNPYTKREVCPLGHLLAQPNLVACRLPHRTCLACSRGRAVVQRARVRRGVFLELKPYADRKYREIMTGLLDVS